MGDKVLSVRTESPFTTRSFTCYPDKFDYHTLINKDVKNVAKFWRNGRRGAKIRSRFFFNVFRDKLSLCSYSRCLGDLVTSGPKFCALQIGDLSDRVWGNVGPLNQDIYALVTGLPHIYDIHSFQSVLSVFRLHDRIHHGAKYHFRAKICPILWNKILKMWGSLIVYPGLRVRCMHQSQRDWNDEWSQIN